jgi:hypothetical protein
MKKVRQNVTAMPKKLDISDSLMHLMGIELTGQFSGGFESVSIFPLKSHFSD